MKLISVTNEVSKFDKSIFIILLISLNIFLQLINFLCHIIIIV